MSKKFLFFYIYITTTIYLFFFQIKRGRNRHIDINSYNRIEINKLWHVGLK